MSSPGSGCPDQSRAADHQAAGVGPVRAKTSQVVRLPAPAERYHLDRHGPARAQSGAQLRVVDDDHPTPARLGHDLLPQQRPALPLIRSSSGLTSSAASMVRSMSRVWSFASTGMPSCSAAAAVATDVGTARMSQAPIMHHTADAPRGVHSGAACPEPHDHARGDQLCSPLRSLLFVPLDHVVVHGGHRALLVAGRRRASARPPARPSHRHRWWPCGSGGTGPRRL